MPVAACASPARWPASGRRRRSGDERAGIHRAAGAGRAGHAGHDAGSERAGWQLHRHRYRFGRRCAPAGWCGGDPRHAGGRFAAAGRFAGFGGGGHRRPGRFAQRARRCGAEP
ncbi:hypothetical protein G6F22_021402 [Rhizopus arrhizus]|nr:hypothetical protein G6F22_021402 [Rhizopus arrhizus]KAG1170607.1 hypothetical protein G6F35_017190 [Rhizopus arrhizus]